MFLLSKPSTARINRFIAAQRGRDFSDPSASIASLKAPSGYSLDYNRIELGEGEVIFGRAVSALRGWEMFHFDWLELYWPHAVIEEGSTVAVLVHHLGFWSLNACRIIQVIDEVEPVRRYGFVYGTLPDHAERGWELFAVEWTSDSNKVFYEILACSRPNKLIARLGYPFARALQKRFAHDSMQAMLRAVHGR